MNLLVTGGAGFIGSNFIAYLLQKYPDYHVVNIDQLTYAGNLENLQQVEYHPNYQFIKGDISNRKLIANLFNTYQFDAVLNFAAESHVDRSIKDPAIFVNTNIKGTHVLLEACKESGASKFIQISTDEVYGSLGEDGYFTENSPIQPSSPYSAAKASADLLVESYYKTYGLHVNITRCSNNYGAYQFPEKLIPLMISKIINKHPLPIYGDGLNVRDWIHVSDHCRAVDLVLHQGRAGHVYNIGANNEHTNLEVVEKLIQLMNAPLSQIKFVKDRPGHDRRYAIDASKISNELGWEPHCTFDNGLKATIEWYLSNPNWLQRIKSGEYVDYYWQHHLGQVEA